MDINHMWQGLTQTNLNRCALSLSATVDCFTSLTGFHLLTTTTAAERGGVKNSGWRWSYVKVVSFLLRLFKKRKREKKKKKKKKKRRRCERSRRRRGTDITGLERGDEEM
ncbi:hypothetical protein YC2023_011040 [Brassica napus]